LCIGFCGDQQIVGAEICDDGNFNDNDGCTNDCQSWMYRVPIDVVGAANTFFANHPVLVILDANRMNLNNAAPDGSDIRFGSDPDPVGGLDLPYWIETWDPAGESRVWVQLPQLDDVGSTFYLFYGFTGSTVPSTSAFDLTFPNTFQPTQDGTITGASRFDAILIDAGITMTIQPGTLLELAAPYVVVDGKIDGTGAGYFRNSGPSEGGSSPNAGGGGGGYGGAGGDGGHDQGDQIGFGGDEIGDAQGVSPVDMGSDGGSGGQTLNFGSGGGGVWIDAYSLDMPGSISVQGTAGTMGTNLRGGGGGAGGGIMLRADHLILSGMLIADGGDGASPPVAGTQEDGGGGGGGGRIKLHYGAGFDDQFLGYSILGGAAGLGGGTPPEDGSDGSFNVENSLPSGVLLPPTFTFDPEETIF
jgi:cysteine-rich repeat protein